MNLNATEKETIREMASCQMNISRVAEKLGCSRNAIYNRLRNIENKTGLDPTDFYGLLKLRFADTEGEPDDF